MIEIVVDNFAGGCGASTGIDDVISQIRQRLAEVNLVSCKKCPLETGVEQKSLF